VFYHHIKTQLLRDTSHTVSKWLVLPSILDMKLGCKASHAQEREEGQHEEYLNGLC